MGSGCPFSGVSWARGEGNMDIMDGWKRSTLKRNVDICGDGRLSENFEYTMIYHDIPIYHQIGVFFFGGGRGVPWSKVSAGNKCGESHMVWQGEALAHWFKRMYWCTCFIMFYSFYVLICICTYILYIYVCKCTVGQLMQCEFLMSHTLIILWMLNPLVDFTVHQLGPSKKCFVQRLTIASGLDRILHMLKNSHWNYMELLCISWYLIVFHGISWYIMVHVELDGLKALSPTARQHVHEHLTLRWLQELRPH